MNMLRLGWMSLWSRRGTALLTVLSIAVSVALLLGVQATRTAARQSFASTVSGVDLVVGARGGALNLLLYSVFRVGDATANVSWESYQKIARHRDVAWAIPLQLGDSHHGYRVLGTSGDYFAHYRHGEDQSLRFAQGVAFSDLYDVVLGAEVARRLGYTLGQRIELTHGLADADFARHADQPFRVVGILSATGTPVDQTVHVSVEALSAIHLDWQSGRPPPAGVRTTAQEARQHDLTPTSITAFMIGMKSRVQTFTMQRAINEYRQEPLQAILPGIVLTQLWELVGVADRALYVVAGGVAIAGLLGMLGAMLAAQRERRREMAILRSVGASPRHLLALLISEALLLCTAAIVIGSLLAMLFAWLAGPLLQARFGIRPALHWPGGEALIFLGTLLLLSLAAGLFVGWRAARGSLSQGLSPQN
jgi:putative ABC transport system permease protein